MSVQVGSHLFSEDDLLPLSALADLAFCQRRAALHLVERIWVDNLLTVEGTYLHEKVDVQDATEVRGDIRIARGLRLRSLRLGLTGRADVVEFQRLEETEANKGMHLVGADCFWRPMPVEYKRGRLRHEEGYEIRLCAQAMCLEEMLNVDVPVGAIYYGKTRRRLELVFTEDLRGETGNAAVRLHELLKSSATPKAERGPKCERCSLLDLCLPKATGGQRDVRKYLLRTVSDTEASTL